MKQPPFCTTNEGLAFALQNSGFKPVYLGNYYTPKKLESLGYEGVLESVKPARLSGRPGNIRFFFEDTKELRSAIAAWDEQAADYLAGKSVLLERPTPEDMMKMARQITQTKKAFTAAVMGLPAFFENREGEVQKVADADNGFTLHCPGFIIASEDLSPEKAAHLGL